MSDRASHFAASLLGVMIGDSMGARVENASAAVIRHRHRGEQDLSALQPGPYGSATEMTLALAESLSADPDFDGDDFARRLVRRHHETRIYGQGTTLAIARLRAGIDWREAGAGRGGYGNAAAARSAPVGLMFGHDVERMRWVAEEAAGLTHAHSFGAEGAVVLSLGVAAALSARGGPLEPLEVLDAVLPEIHTREFRSHLESAVAIARRPWDPGAVVERLGNNQTALGSVVTALACFACHTAGFEEALISAMALGGNSSSIAAMTGAMAGAYHGLEGIPKGWLEGLESAEITAEIMRSAGRALEAQSR